MTFRYIGSKARVVEQIAEHVGYAKDGFFVDVFCGTGAVAEIAADMGWPVRLNDHLASATTMAAARLLSAKEAQFKELGGYEAAIATLNRCPATQGFMWREYSPASFKKLGIERRYFSEENAARIDGLRAQIRKWRNAGMIGYNEEMLLIGDLLAAVSRVANIAGTYGCFLAKWTSQAAKCLTLRMRDLKPRITQVEINNVDAFQVRTNPEDLVYLDPPYTKRQYASYYHILETVARGDEPTVEGVAGLRPWRSLASDFCYKVRALKTLTNLIVTVSARRILLSYSNEGHVELGALRSELNRVGKVHMYELGSIGRYRPNQQASAKRSSVKEFLIVIEKTVTRVAGRTKELVPA
jgi:adenine-specific DNA-methyltransferase